MNRQRRNFVGPSTERPRPPPSTSFSKRRHKNTINAMKSLDPKGPEKILRGATEGSTGARNLTREALNPKRRNPISPET